MRDASTMVIVCNYTELREVREEQKIWVKFKQFGI
jgi:hypothetical protein